MPGLHFGTVYHPEAAILRTQAQTAGLVHQRRLPTTALAGAWLYNTGGPTWTADQMEGNLARAPSLLALARAGVLAGTPFDFAAALAACNAVSDRDLQAIAGGVPAEWGLHGWEAENIAQFLRRRRYLDRWAAKLAAAWRRSGPGGA